MLAAVKITPDVTSEPADVLDVDFHKPINLWPRPIHTGSIPDLVVACFFHSHGRYPEQSRVELC